MSTTLYYRHCDHCLTSRPDHPERHTSPCPAQQHGRPCRGSMLDDAPESRPEQPRDWLHNAVMYQIKYDRLRAVLSAITAACDSADHSVGYVGEGPSGRVCTTKLRALLAEGEGR